MKKVNIVSFTALGAKRSEEVARVLGELSGEWNVQQYEKTAHPTLSRAVQIKESLPDWCRGHFQDCELLIFIGAVGITVRGIASCVQDKFTDPAVLVLDEMGKYVIPLLSGHVGGANEIARFLAERFDAEAIITTATDLHHLFAVDVFAKENNLIIAHRQQAKMISASLLLGEKVYFYIDKKGLETEGLEIEALGKIADLPEMTFVSEAAFKNLMENKNDSSQEDFKIIIVSDKTLAEQYPEKNSQICQLIPQCNVLGIGCRKGIASDILEQTIVETLAAHQISLQSIGRIATIDIKQKETAICDFAEKYQLPVDTFTAEELMEMDGTFTSSAFVLSQTGTDNVCERAAMVSVQRWSQMKESKDGLHDGQREMEQEQTTYQRHMGYMQMKKQAGSGITLAVAMKDWSVRFG